MERYPESGPEEKDRPVKDVEKNSTWGRRHWNNAISRKRRVDSPNIEEEKDVAVRRRAGDTRNQQDYSIVSTTACSARLPSCYIINRIILLVGSPEYS